MLHLTDHEKAMHAGDEGPCVRRAMEIVRALADVARAERLVPVVSVQVAGVSYRNLGDAGLELLQTWADQGARARVPAWMNPCGVDLAAWQALGYPPEFVAKQNQVVAALEALGVEPTLTCTPYHVHAPPERGSHLAWSESSAVSVANSVFGARTNREGGPSALAAALCGRTPLSGFHLDENRRATHRIQVRCAVETPDDFGALGAAVGAIVGDGVPCFEDLALPDDETRMAALKQLAAAMAAAGAVALFHVPGVTPEADDPAMAPEGLAEVQIDSLDAARTSLRRPGQRVDLVALGCPHLSASEAAAVARQLKGRTVRVPLWVCLSRAVAAEAEQRGDARTIREAGAVLVCDTCVVVAPLQDLGFEHVAVNSAKAAIYLAMHGDGGVCFGSLAECVEAAACGAWPGAPACGVTLEGRAVVGGEAEGELLCTSQPISFYGGVDPDTGEVRDRTHELFGQNIAGKVLAFPSGKGSTVGSYVLYALRRNGVAPCALLVERADPVVAAGAVIAGIPMIDGIERSSLTTGRHVRIRGPHVITS